LKWGLAPFYTILQRVTFPEERKQKIFFVDQEYLKESGKFNKIIEIENIIARKIY